MDASSLKVAGTATLHVKNAAGEPLYDGENAVQIVVHGRGSRAFSIVETRQTARTLRRMNDNDGKVTAAPADERRADAAEDLAALTISFENLTYGDKVGPDLFQAVYADPELGFIATQVTKYLADWANFRPASPAN